MLLARILRHGTLLRVRHWSHRVGGLSWSYRFGCGLCRWGLSPAGLVSGEVTGYFEEVVGGFGVCDPADRLGAALIQGVGVAEEVQRAGEFVDGGIEPDHIAGRRSDPDPLCAVIVTRVGVGDEHPALL